MPTIGYVIFIISLTIFIPFALGCGVVGIALLLEDKLHVEPGLSLLLAIPILGIILLATGLLLL